MHLSHRGEGAFAPRLKLLNEVMNQCDMDSLMHLAQTSTFNWMTVRHHIYLRKWLLADHFFNDPDSFYKMLSDCCAGFSGSAALLLLLPAANCTWMPNDMDLYSPASGYCRMKDWLLQEGFSVVWGRKQETSGYHHSEISMMVKFTNGHWNVDVVLSKTEAALAPVFKFHSTAVMNFVGGNVIFCAYPQLTFQYHARVNPAVAYSGNMGMDTMDALRKYGLCGFHYVGWPERERMVPDAPYQTRAVTNRFSMWLNTRPWHAQQFLIKTSGENLVSWMLNGTWGVR